jgi:hypothetical protein
VDREKMTDEDESTDEPKRVTLVTRDGSLIEDYADEVDFAEETPLADLPDTQAVIDAANAKKLTATFKPVIDARQQEINDIKQGIENVHETNARTEAFKSPEGKLGRMASDSQRDGETYEQAYARETFAHPELYEAQRESKKQREQFESIRRKQDRGQL